MRVVAFNGSARRHGNTSSLIEAVFAPMRESGVECEEVPLSGRSLRGCIACYKCFEAKDGRCHGPDDDMNTMLEQVEKADGIIIASPTYFADVSTETKALIDRAGYATRQAVDPLLRRKVGAAVVAARRAGAIHAFDTINHFFLIAEMVIPGSSYWNVGYGRERGDVESDEEGMRTMRQLGENMAWLLGLIGGEATA
jgi:multimeric flavodoxin WrbA